MFEIGSAVAKIKADTSEFQKGVKEVGNGLNDLGGTVKKIGSVIATAFAVDKIIDFGKKASREAMEFEKAMVTLDIISERFGVSASKAKDTAKKLGDELRIGLASSAESLQNLLKSGLSLDQAENLMRRFTNEALTGKSASVSLADAVQNLSFAYATNNSALGNLSGISENWSNIVDRGTEIMSKWNGKANEGAGITQELADQIIEYEKQLKEQGKTLEKGNEEQAKYIGLLQLTNLTMGSAEAFTGTLADKQANYEQVTRKLNVAVGDFLNPTLARLVDIKTQLVKKILEVIEKFGTLNDSISQNYEWLTVLSTVLTVSVIPAIVSLGVQTLITATVGMAKLIASTVRFIVEGWKEIAMIMVKIVQLGIATGAIVLHTSVTIAQTVATGALTTATWLLNTALTVLTSPIFLVIAAIGALIAIGVLLYKNWEVIKEKASQLWKFITDGFWSLVGKIGEIGGYIFEKLKEPFEKAWNVIKDIVNKIKDALDFTKRHSPSVVDIVQKGVGLVNNAFDNLKVGISPIDTSKLAVAGVGAGSVNPIINIDLSGAYVGDEDVGEKIGDAIISKLQKNVRF